MALSPGARVGVYEVTARIDEGGMGVVWRARDTRLQRDVALKVLPDTFGGDPDRLARFEREARTLASLNHPNIAQVYGLEAFKENSGGATPAQVLVMELVEGPTLADRIAQGALPLDEVLPIARQIAEALEAAHEQGIVHRDLKPANVKIRPDGTVKVLDFGLAKAMEPAGGLASGSQAPTITTPAMTQAGVILGTAAYMSPEQARGKPVDRRTDMWAFGCVLYEMLTGRQAFDGEDLMALLARIQEREPDLTVLPARTPSAIRRLIRRCLVKDPRQRLSEASTARLEIDEARTPSDDVSVSKAARPWWRHTLMPAVIFLVASLATGAAVWLAVRQTPRPSLLDVVPPRTAPLFGDVGLAVYLAYGGLFALLPDGSGLVYVATDSDGQRQLMLHYLDQLEPVPITGTEGALSPFISPDSEWVAYFTGVGELMRVGIEGGMPDLIADLPGQFGRGAWCADDTIVIAQATGLWTVTASSGELEGLALAEADENFQSPQCLPDGSGVLFTIASVGEMENTRVVVLDWATRTIHDVTSGGINTRYVPSGHLVYNSAGALWAVRFDLESRTRTGAPFRVLDEDAQEFDVSIDDTLAFVRGGPAGGTGLVWVDRDGIETPIVGLEPGLYFMPRLSPDESRVAYYHADAGHDVEVLNLRDRGIRHVTLDPHQDLAPAWVDDEWMVFASSRNGSLNVFRKRADGSGEADQLTNSEDIVYPLEVTAEGTIALLVARVQEGAQVGLKTMEAESEVQLIGRGGNPTISADGRWIAYSSSRSGSGEIWVQPLASEGGPWQVSQSGGGDESLFAKGGAAQELYYRRRSDGAMMVVRYTGEAIFEVESIEELFPDNRYRPRGAGLNLRSYDVSGDGSRFLMVQEADPRDSPLRIGVFQHWLEVVKRLDSAR